VGVMGGVEGRWAGRRTPLHTTTKQTDKTKIRTSKPISDLTATKKVSFLKGTSRTGAKVGNVINRLKTTVENLPSAQIAAARKVGG